MVSLFRIDFGLPVSQKQLEKFDCISCRASQIVLLVLQYLTMNFNEAYVSVRRAGY